MNISNREEDYHDANIMTQYNQVIDLLKGNPWWLKVLKLICRDEQKQKEFFLMYYNAKNLSNSIMNYRTALMQREEIDVKSFMKSGEKRDIPSMQMLIENIFYEPTNSENIEKLYILVESGVTINDMVKYYHNHPGRRFVSMLKNFQR